MDGMSAQEMLSSVGGGQGNENPAPGMDAAPKSTESPGAPPPDAGKKEEPWWTSRIKDEVEYTANGKPIREPLEMILKRASQGYNYAQHMEGLNKQLGDFEKTKGDLESRVKRWEEYERFAKENPDYNKFLEEQWNRRDQWKSGLMADPDNPLTKTVISLHDQIKGLETQLSERFKSFDIEKEDSALDNEIKGVKNEYKDIDFDQRDELGKSLEFRVIEHAAKTGIKNFRAAFRDFYHDELTKLAETRAKEQMLKDSRDKKAQGIIGGKPTPGGNQKPTSKLDIRSKSYDQLSQLAKEELRQSGMN